ncbi:MAG TPA: gamma-glutamyltransferase [Polyangiaceae bacterium]|nr:gamma-glutamyltransferase [Polyangiaceae bacterium]
MLRRSDRSRARLTLGLALCLSCSRLPQKPGSATGVASSVAPAPALAKLAVPSPAAPAPPPSAAKEAETPPRVLAGGPRAVASTHGLVVAVEARAARIGADVLEQGGNAVDAAVATLLALTVTHPSAASLGGQGFALVRRAAGPSEALDFVARAPRALTRPAFDRMISGGARGAAAVAVPGVVAGLAALHARFGTRPFSELVAPALALARNGYPLGEWQATLVRNNAATLKRDPAAKTLFFERGRPRTAGQPFVQRDLAWTLEQLAKSGADDFYRGVVAERLAKSLAPEGPTLADLNDYQAIWRTPLALRYRDVTLETMPPPSAGGVALVGALLALQAEPTPAAESPAEIHLLLEAEKRGQAERRHGVLDPDALSESERNARLSRWLDPAFWLRVKIDPEHATKVSALAPLTPAEPVESEHTTHLSVSDRDGMVVSLTTTLCASFGARIVAAGTGIVLNNAVATFSASGENLPTPSRRTVSSMAPTLLLSADRTVAVLGSPGGDTIPSTLTQLVRRLVDHGQPLDSAIDAPRWHHGFLPDEARYEAAAGKDEHLLTALTRLGHSLRRSTRRMGDANCIVFDRERAYGYADLREPGAAIAPMR